MSHRTIVAPALIAAAALALGGCSATESGIDRDELAAAVSAGTGADGGTAECVADFLLESGLSDDALAAVIEEPTLIGSTDTSFYSEADLEIIAGEEYASGIDDCLAGA